MLTHTVIPVRFSLGKVSAIMLSNVVCQSFIRYAVKKATALMHKIAVIPPANPSLVKQCGSLSHKVKLICESFKVTQEFQSQHHLQIPSY